MNGKKLFAEQHIRRDKNLVNCKSMVALAKENILLIEQLLNTPIEGTEGPSLMTPTRNLDDSYEE